MHLNSHTALCSPTLLLVPYEPHHVPTYHAWMASPELQELTASEPLSLEQEYEMQRAWRREGDKLTFIICLPLDRGQKGDGGQEGEREVEVVRRGVDDGEGRMVGDVNLFLFHADDEEGEEAQPSKDHSVNRPIIGELELMIASPAHRHQGYGRSALLTFIVYILTHWPSISEEFTQSPAESLTSVAPPPLAYFRARINESNTCSIGLFESLGFERTGAGANYFGEVELRWMGEVEDLRVVKGWTGVGREARYG